MTPTLVHRIYSFVLALLLCATVVDATPLLACSNNVPPQAAETTAVSGSYGQLQPVW
jgi:hypothetical protein